MVRESQTPRVTQIQVRVDCNGCVQKIKKALNSIHGINDLRVDLNRQKLTIIGWAEPEKVVKAIKKKTRKNATICSNIELTCSKPTEPESKGKTPAPDATQPLPTEAPPSQARHLSEPPPEQPPPQATSSSSLIQHNASQHRQNNPETDTEDVGQVNMMHNHLPNHVNRFSSGLNYYYSPVFIQEPSQLMHVTHSYNTYMPSPYVTEYEYVRSPSRHTHYNHMEHCSREYQDGNVNITSMFSDDNPNACSIV